MSEDGLTASVISNAEAAVHNCGLIDPSLSLDYSRGSLDGLEKFLGQLAEWLSSEPDPTHMDNFTRTMGSYVLEVARREFGGSYRWSSERDQPVLVCGDDESHVAMMALDKVRGRLGGDEGDNVPFFYEGFVQEVARAVPSRRALYV